MSLAIARTARRRPSLRRDAKTQLALWLRGSGWWVEEYRFHPVRKWRFDWTLWAPATGEDSMDSRPHPALIAIEYQGGTFNAGGHVRGKQYSRDMEKLIVAQLLGWMVLPITSDMVTSGLAYDLIGKAVCSRTTVADYQPHACETRTPGCFRCELGADEVAAQPQPRPTPAARRRREG